jgi:lysophospholipase L1-like esterase
MTYMRRLSGEAPRASHRAGPTLFAVAAATLLSTSSLGCSSDDQPAARAGHDAGSGAGQLDANAAAPADAPTSDGTLGDGGAGDATAGDASSVLDPSTVDAGMGGPPPALTASVTLHVAGDSTAAIFPSTDPRVGWAAVLQSFFGAGVTVDDAAVSGASTKSFVDQGYWASLQARLEPGDYLFIEFAHNDEKNNDPTRYTDPATSYPYYLKTFVAGARAKGAFAVLMTSICRRYFSGNNAIGTHGAYTTALKAVGVETSTPVIDMETKTLDWLDGLGPTNSIPMFAPGDNTHLSAMGAPQVAALAVQGMEELGFPIIARVSPYADGGWLLDATTAADGAAGAADAASE